MKKVLWLTPKLLPINGGQQMHSLGNMKAINNIVELKVIAKIEINDNLDEIMSDEIKDLDVKFVSPYISDSWKNKLDHPISKFIALQEGFFPMYRRLKDLLITTIDEFHPDFIIIDFIGMYKYYKFLKNRYPQIKYIYHSLNAEYINFIEERENKRDFTRIFNSYWIKHRKEAEHILLRDCVASLCISLSDIDILKKEFPDAKLLVHSKPLIFFEHIKPIESINTFEKKLMIIGSMNWYPNIRGIIWFINNVFSKLIKRDIEYKLYIVGRDPNENLIELCKKYKQNIILTGSVPSTNPYFKMCDISIIPIFEGTGAKIKVLESIGKGIPTICSSFAAKDYGIRNNEVVVVDQNVDDYLNAILRIECDITFRNNLVQKMQKFYNNYFVLNEEIIELFA